MRCDELSETYAISILVKVLELVINAFPEEERFSGGEAVRLFVRWRKVSIPASPYYHANGEVLRAVMLMVTEVARRNDHGVFDRQGQHGRRSDVVGCSLHRDLISLPVDWTEKRLPVKGNEPRISMGLQCRKSHVRSTPPRFASLAWSQTGVRLVH